jgi:hypothetical protein
MEVTHASLRREKLWILRTKEFFEESNRSTPRDSVLLTQNLHWMLWIRQVSIKGRGIVDNDIHKRL